MRNAVRTARSSGSSSGVPSIGSRPMTRGISVHPVTTQEASADASVRTAAVSVRDRGYQPVRIVLICGRPFHSRKEHPLKLDVRVRAETSQDSNGARPTAWVRPVDHLRHRGRFQGCASMSRPSVVSTGLGWLLIWRLRPFRRLSCDCLGPTFRPCSARDDLRVRSVVGPTRRSRWCPGSARPGRAESRRR